MRSMVCSRGRISCRRHRVAGEPLLRKLGAGLDTGHQRRRVHAGGCSWCRSCVRNFHGAALAHRVLFRGASAFRTSLPCPAAAPWLSFFYSYRADPSAATWLPRTLPQHGFQRKQTEESQRGNPTRSLQVCVLPVFFACDGNGFESRWGRYLLG